MQKCSHATSLPADSGFSAMNRAYRNQVLLLVKISDKIAENNKVTAYTPNCLNIIKML